MEKSLMRRFTLGLVAGVTALAVLVAPSGATSSPEATPIKPATMTDIKIGTTGLTINLFWDLMVAREAGFFRANNLNPQFITISTPGTLVSAAAAGSTDFVTVATDSIVNAIDQQGPLKIVAGQALGSFSLVSRSSITSFAQLRGKKIGIADANAGSTLLLLALLKKNGLSRNDVSLVPAAATAQRFAALQAGAVDAALLSQPADFVAEDQGFKILGNTASAIRRYQITAHAVNTNWAQNNRAAVIAYVRAIRNSQQFLWNKANKEKAIQIFIDATKVNRSVAERTYKLMFEDLKTMSVNAQIEPTAINNVLKIMAETIGGGPRTPAKYYDQTFLAQSLPAVTVSSFSARAANGVVVARIFASRASTATLQYYSGGKKVGAAVKKKLKAGTNRLGLKIPRGLDRKKTTLRARVVDSAGSSVTKTATVRF